MRPHHHGRSGNVFRSAFVLLILACMTVGCCTSEEVGKVLTLGCLSAYLHRRRLPLVSQEKLPRAAVLSGIGC